MYCDGDGAGYAGITLGEGGTFLFAAEAGDQGGEEEDGGGGGGHGGGVAHVLGEEGFKVGDGAGEQDAALVGEAWEETSDRVRRELTEMRGDDAPGSLYAELQEKRSGD